MGFNFFKKKPKQTDLKQKSAGVNNHVGHPSFFITDDTASWLDLTTPGSLLGQYKNNPAVNAVINIEANAFSNLRFKIKDLKSGEVTTLEESKDEDIKKLLKSPNPWQTTNEWLRSFRINKLVFGNGYLYASVPVGYENSFDYTDVKVLNVLNSYLITPKITGNWLEAEDITDVVSYYEFNNTLKSRVEKLDTLKILHINEPNIELDRNFVTGKSKLIALSKPISNIMGAFESRNVLIKKRGALGFLSSDKKDGDLGTLPLNEDEVEETQEGYQKYGLMSDQYQLLILNQPLKYQQMGMSVKELMLFEEVESSTIAIANSYGVPELLVKAYVKGGTFENLIASERRLYDSTIIPESEIFINGLNDFLKTKEKGIEIIGSFEHVKCLQKNQKEEAETHAIKERAVISAFRIGAITYNQYLQAIGLPNDPAIGEQKIWDLDEKKLEVIMSNQKKETNE